MTRISNVSNLLLGTTVGAVAVLALQSAPANAASLTFSSESVDATSSTGLSFSGGGNFLSTDVFSLTVSGTPNFAPTTNSYITNAAGILTQPLANPPASTGSFFTRDGASIGALLIGNSTLGFFQLFPSNTANGSGSSAPPTNLSLSNVTLGSIFGTALDTNPTSVLNLIASDSEYPDNSGAYVVSGSVVPAAAVPEPFTIIGTLVGGTAAVRMRKKLQEVGK